MINLLNIRMADNCGETELRLDWTNARHNAVKINSRSPQEVARGLEDLVYLIKRDLKTGKLDEKGIKKQTTPTIGLPFKKYGENQEKYILE